MSQLSGRFQVARRARELALCFLYQSEIESIFYFTEQRFHHFCEHYCKDESSAQSIAKVLSQGVMEFRLEFDQRISSVSRNWAMARMPIIDLNILRLGSLELKRQVVPPRVAIHEAVALGKLYGHEKSGSFINGILDQVARCMNIHGFTRQMEMVHE